MADKIAIGTRVLFQEHAGGQVREGVARAYSPTGNWLCLEIGDGDDCLWVNAQTYGVVEVLAEAPKPKAKDDVSGMTVAEFAAHLAAKRGTQQPEQPEITGKLDEIKADLLTSMAGSEAPLPTTTQGVKLATN